MDMLLTHTLRRADGIFGELSNMVGVFMFYTLEHAYLDPDTGLYVTKVADGVYDVKTGTGPLPGGLHSLSDGKPFNAFQLQDVPPFQGIAVTNILMHIGNYNEETEGCILLGKQIGHKSNNGLMLSQSGEAFAEFMKLQASGEFQLTIEG